MIFDHISNSHLYVALNPRIKNAFEYIRQNDLLSIGVGRYEIDGQNLYAMVQQYNTKPIKDGSWEAHRRYIDLQYLVQGMERIGYCNIHRLFQGAYDASRDYLPLQGEGDYATLREGDFAIFFPEDAHMPGIALDVPVPIKKLVIKVAVASGSGQNSWCR
jgi:biofilm protein TabA